MKTSMMSLLLGEKGKHGLYWTIHLTLDHGENKMKFQLVSGEQSKLYECPMNRHHFEAAYP